MTYNTILVQLDVDAPAGPRLAFAWELARRFEANMIAFSAADISIFIPGDLDGSAAAEAMRYQVQDIEERQDAMKKEFDAIVGDDNRATWRAVVGDPTAFLALHARAADLIVIAPGLSESFGRRRTVDAGSLILSAGRPILMAGDELRPVKAENALVAWKDTREARRSVVDALPFLRSARDVLVAAVEENDRVAQSEGLADVVRFLLKHGVNARSQLLDAGSDDTASILADAARKAGADLIVSGGYGHTRLREWVFGGVTRGLLDDGSVHRLIAS
ncbi:MAG: universal stress protein [Mesorhizobium sp.]